MRDKQVKKITAAMDAESKAASKLSRTSTQGDAEWARAMSVTNAARRNATEAERNEANRRAR